MGCLWHEDPVPLAVRSILYYLTTYDKMRRTCLKFGHGRQGRAAARLLHCPFGSSVQPQIRRPKLPQSFVDTEYCLHRICFNAQICQAPAAEAPRLRPQSDSHAQWYLLLSPACSGTPQNRTPDFGFVRHP